MDEPTTDPLDTMMESEVLDEASEAPEATEDSQSQESEATEGQPRDDVGRFTEREDSSPDPEAAPAAPSEEPPETPPDTAEGVQPVSFTYRADGQQYDIAGATIGDDGAVVIPKDSVAHVQQVLSAGRHHFGGWQRDRQGFQEQVKQAQAEVEAANLTRAALLEQFETVVKMTPEQRLDWAEGFVGEWPAIRAQAEQAGVEASRQADRTRLEQFERQELERELLPQLQQGLEEHMTRAQAEDPLFKDMVKDDLMVVYDKLLNGWQSNGLLRTTENQPWNGEQNPQIDLMLMKREMEYVASLRRRTTATAQQVTAAGKTNAAELQEGKAPPAVTTKTGTPADGKPIKRFKLPKGVDPDSAEATELVDEWAESLEV